MLSDLMVEPVSIACRGQQRHQCEYTDQCQFITFYLLRIRIHIYCQLALLIFFRNGAMACFELHSKHMRVQFQVPRRPKVPPTNSVLRLILRPRRFICLTKRKRREPANGAYKFDEYNQSCGVAAWYWRIMIWPGQNICLIGNLGFRIRLLPISRLLSVT